MRRAAMTFVAVTIALAAVSAAAFGQVRDVQRPAVGTASISGVVITDSPTPRPIRRVLVQLTEVNGARQPVGVITDDAGLFSFTDLPVGTYTLVATRATYVPSAYGAKRYGRGSGVPISIAAGQVVKDVTLKMIKGGVITGTLRDPAGRPAANAEVILLTSRTDSGRRKMAAIAQGSQTNARGEYRIFGLAPGDYVLRAQPPSRMGQPELRPTTAAELEWARKRAAGSTTEPPPSTGRPVAYAASYYPGTGDITTASPVTVGPGEERAGIDFAFQLIPTATISGRVSTPDGQVPKNTSASLQVQSTSAGSFIDTLIGVASTGGFGGGVRVGQDGTFSVSGVAPGRYRLTLRGAPATAAARPGADMAGLAMSMPGMAAVVGSTLWAVEDLSINGQDVTALDIRLQPGLLMSGTVAFEGEDPQAPPDASRASLMLNSADRESSSALDLLMSMMAGSTPGRTLKDRTFTIDGVAPGRYRLIASPPGVVNPFGAVSMVSPDGWVLKSVMWKGRDIADGAFDIQQGDELSGVVVTFSKAVTEISGRLLDASGRPTSGLPIVVFSTRPADWAAGSRRVVSAKPASDGSYRIRGLPAGDYYLCALTDLDMNDLYDAAFLEQLVGASFKLTLTDGEKKTQDLKLGGE
ncbi:MAG: carboxypeptidase regulatory-like domain-containing protein [Acidobacteria bacterium]|nr:MAG: carboxypeptidase regulatory-like domain-containing protein [Acidobacteriota bacterium]